MFITFKLILATLVVRETLGQFITHPFGAFSYISNTFQHGVGYRYVAPSGQTVNVKYATSALAQPPQESSPQFVFNSAVPAPAPLTLSLNQEHQFSAFQPQGLLGFPQNSAAKRLLEPPTAESLFTPANSGVPISSEKQLQAFSDYLNELQRESAGITTQASTDFDRELENLESFVGVNLGSK